MCGPQSLTNLLPGPLRQSLLTLAWENNLFSGTEIFPGVSFFLLPLFLSVLFCSFLFILPQFCSSSMFLYFFLLQKRHCYSTSKYYLLQLDLPSLHSFLLRITHHSSQNEPLFSDRVRTHEQIGIQSSKIMWPESLIVFIIDLTPASLLVYF